MDSWRSGGSAATSVARPLSKSLHSRRRRLSAGRRDTLDGVDSETLLSARDDAGSAFTGSSAASKYYDDGRLAHQNYYTEDVNVVYDIEAEDLSLSEGDIGEDSVETEVRRSIFRNKSLPKVAEDFGISQKELVHTSKGRMLQAVLFGLAITGSAVGKLVYQWFLTDPSTGAKGPPEGFDPLTLYNASFLCGACVAAATVAVHRGPKRLLAFERSVWLAALVLGLPLIVSECMDMYILARLSPLLALILGQTKIPLSVILRAVMLRKRPSFMEALILLCLTVSITGYTLNARNMAVAAAEAAAKAAAQLPAAAAAAIVPTSSPAASSPAQQIQGVILAALNVTISLGGCVMFEGYAGNSPLLSHELFFVIRLTVACMMYVTLLAYKSFLHGAVAGLRLCTVDFFRGWNFRAVVLMALCSAKDLIGCLVVCRLNVVWKVLSTTVSVMLLYIVECCQQLRANPVQAALLVVALLHVFAFIFCSQAAKAAAAAAAAASAAQLSRVK